MMIFFSNFLDIFYKFLSLEWIFYFFLIFIFLITIYNIILLILYNKRIKEFKKHHDPEKIGISDFKSLPIVNIIIPAWKEGEIFKNLLLSITKLDYPKIKVITNAGGSIETLEIVNSFKSNENFIILHQKDGSDRPSLGKINAINECFNHVIEGIIYFIDADSYLNNEILLRMIYPIINLNEDVVIGGVRPLINQMKKPLVKYLQFDRFKALYKKFERHSQTSVITGQNFCINYNVLKAIKRFTFQKLIPTDGLMGKDIYRKGFKPYRLVDYRHRIFVDYSANLTEYFHQRLIWNENYLYKSLKLHHIINIIKFIFLWLISTYLIIFPILIFFDLRFLFPGLLIFLTVYFKKISRLIVFTRTVDKKYYEPYRVPFFFILIFYIFFDTLITVYVAFHFLYFLKKLEKSNSQ
ncbi:MAG: glycosyltransferase [Promethearchaeota archaeon]